MNMLLVLAAATLLAGNPPAQPDLSAAEVRKNVIAAAERIEEAYRHVRITARQTQFKPGTGQPLWISEDEYLVEGDHVRADVRVIESEAPNMAAGERAIYGGSAAKYFRLTKYNGTNDFFINHFFARPAVDFDAVMHHHCFPAYIPYCIAELRLVDYLNLEGVKLISARRITLDGQQVVEVITEYAYPASEQDPAGTVGYRFWFDAQSWVLIGRSLFTPPFDPDARFYQYRLSYEPGSEPPKLMRVEGWSLDPTEPGKKLTRQLWEITSFEFRNNDLAEFGPAAFGVAEPKGDVVCQVPDWMKNESAANNPTPPRD